MNESTAIFKSIVIYGICVPLSIFIGYQLRNPLTYTAFGWIGFLLFVMSFPLLFRWHQPMLLLAWNATAVLFFIPGRPDIWMVMSVLSLGISLLQRTLNRHMRFIHVPHVTWSLIALLLVVLFTAKLTGGIGLRSLGGSVYGGKRYVALLCGIVAYFAITAQRIPLEKAKLYMGLFFLGGITYVMGDFFSLTSPSLYFIFWIFPPNIIREDIAIGTTRLGGVMGLGIAIYSYLLATHGVRRLFAPQGFREYIRLFIFISALVMGMLGGYRSMIILAGLTLMIQFYLEGLHRTKLLPAFILASILMVPIMIPLAHKLPFTLQRALAFLPLNLNPDAVADAEGSAQWRIKIWKAVLPQVPNYLLLGKGYSLTQEDYDEVMTTNLGASGTFEENSSMAVSGDYHSGPLSVVMPFGIWGVIAFIWFVTAGIRALYANFRYGPAELKLYNGFLFASFVAKILMFLFIFGSLHSDFYRLAGLVALSISLNNGVCRKSTAAIQTSRSKGAVINILRRPRPVFQS